MYEPPAEFTYSFDCLWAHVLVFRTALWFFLFHLFALDLERISTIHFVFSLTRQFSLLQTKSFTLKLRKIFGVVSFFEKLSDSMGITLAEEVDRIATIIEKGTFH